MAKMLRIAAGIIFTVGMAGVINSCAEVVPLEGGSTAPPGNNTPERRSFFSGQLVVTESDSPEPTTMTEAHTTESPELNQFGIKVDGHRIQLWVMVNSTSIMSMEISSDGHSFPTNLDLGNDLAVAPARGHVAYGGMFYQSSSGSLVITSCPREANSKVGGRFTDAKFINNSNTNNTVTVNGNFEVRVVESNDPAVECTVAPDLPPEGDPPPDDGNGDSPQPPPPSDNECHGADRCAEDGVCCPIEECYQSCFTQNCEWICSTGQMEACFQCEEQCIEGQCDGPQGCVDGLSPYMLCSRDNCADATSVELLEACRLSNCCPQWLYMYR